MSQFDIFTNKFSYDIYKEKYSMNGQEFWSDTCKRVVNSVCSQYLDNSTKEKIYNLMLERKFIPGGRYLYSSGRPYHQLNNCFMFRANDSREDWADAVSKATLCLMSGGGIGFDYSKLREKGSLIKKTGGNSSGPMALVHMINELGRYIKMGNQRRSAIWAGLNWNHPDILDFINLKQWSEDLLLLKRKNPNFVLPMSGTNISVIYDTDFFVSIENKNHPNHKLAKKIWKENCIRAFSKAEPGFSFNYLKDNESLRNAPITGLTRVMTSTGYKYVKDIIEKEVEVFTGKQWVKTTFRLTKKNSELVKVSLTNGRDIICSPEHPFIVKNYIRKGKNKKIETIRIPAELLKEKQKIHSELPLNIIENYISNQEYANGFIFGDGYIRNYKGELRYFVDSKKECFEIAKKALNGWSRGTPNIFYFKSNVETKLEFLGNFPLSKDFIAGWFDATGCYTKNLLRLSCSNIEYLYKCQESLDFLGIKSIVREDGTSNYKSENKSYTLAILSCSLLRFKKLIPTVRVKVLVEDNYIPYRESEIRIKSVEKLDYKEDVYCCNVGVEEHSFLAEGVIISNCNEVTSEDDSDRCNLGTVWINRFDNKEEFGEAVKYATLFLLCGGIYSDVPTQKIKEIGDKNNRIGLGIGGFHEWLIIRGYDYEVPQELHKWLHIYVEQSDSSAYIGAKNLGISIPKAKRAIAPNGTTGIIAESTTGIEPLFCKAYKRLYLHEDTWKYQYVIDGMVKRLLDKGIKIENIKDSYDLDFKQRVKFQADIQNYVDMSISSTCNLPTWGSEKNNKNTLEEYSKILLKYAKRLRGFTCYPDNAMEGQPLERVSLEEAFKNEGMIFEEKERECIGGICGL